MKNWKPKTAGAIVLGAILWFAIATFLDKRTVDEVRYDQLLTARRAEFRFLIWGTKSGYRFFSKFIKFDPVEHYRTKADDLEKSLQKSGALISMTFYGQGPFDTGLINPSLVQNSDPDAQFVRSYNSTDSTTLVCRPRDASYWLGVFCSITNRVRAGVLRKLGGNREEIDCQLPDGQVVDLQTCQKWLNESVESGWLVGVCSSNRILIASRRMPGE